MTTLKEIEEAVTSGDSSSFIRLLVLLAEAMSAWRKDGSLSGNINSMRKNFDSGFGDNISEVLRTVALPAEAKGVSGNWVQTFGGFKVTLDGRQIDFSRWRSKKAVDLMAFLILKYPNAVHKEMLIEFLWPETEPNLGIKRLHHVISELRHYLQPKVSGYMRKQYIHYEHHEYRISLGEPDKEIIDHVLFEQITQAGNRLWLTGNQEGAKNLYSAALLFKQGELFPKYRYESEFEDRRERLNKLEERILNRMGEQRI